MFAKQTDSVPRTGRTPLASSQSSAMAPHTSLPCVSACSQTCGPGRPESKVQT